MMTDAGGSKTAQQQAVWAHSLQSGSWSAPIASGVSPAATTATLPLLLPPG